eukprot:scaffold110227_cov33-Tisochrysis_lutea.AAC.3
MAHAGTRLVYLVLSTVVGEKERETGRKQTKGPFAICITGLLTLATTLAGGMQDSAADSSAR